MGAKAKPKKCRVCGTEYTPWSTNQVVCSVACSIKYGKEKAAKKRRAENAKAKREFYRKDKKHQLKRAITAFNAFIRERDKHKGCISCGVTLQGRKFDAGHYRSAGGNPAIRFEEQNCHGQCVPCNRNLSGNLINYRIGLVDRLSLEAVEWLEGPHDAKHYTADDLHEIAATYNRKLKELQQCNTSN